MGACSTLKWAPESATPCKGEASEGHDAKSPCANVKGASVCCRMFTSVERSSQQLE